ncbi:hypothetical protein MRX96_024727 [Rhipicephalus microplus]
MNLYRRPDEKRFRWCCDGYGELGTVHRKSLVHSGKQLIAAAAEQEAREIVESEEMNKAGLHCVSRPTTIPMEYTDDHKIHFQRVSSEYSSESDDEIVPKSVCTPVLGSSQEPANESTCQ